MRFYFPQYFTARSRFLSYTVVAHVLRLAGHEVCDDESDCDAALFSMCDVTEYPALRRMRQQTRLPLIVGGAYAFNFWSAKLYADGVWVGEVFDMADHDTLDALLASPHCYTGNALPIASTRIEWPQVPLARIAPSKCYYWGGVGCKNKCRFCFTSWTHLHQVNSAARIETAKQQAARRGLSLMISANEYSDGHGGRTQDMLLRDYLRVPLSGGMVRCGIEFATDESRRRNGKPITDKELRMAIAKAAAEGVGLRLFHISGYDSRADWDGYIDLLCGALERARPRKLMHLMFNNLQYQNYTPLYRERRDIEPERYLTVADSRAFYDRLRQHTSSVLVGAPSPFQHVACRMGIELSRERAQVDFWLSRLNNARHKMTAEQAHEHLLASGVFDTPMLRMDQKSGAITIVEGG